MDNPIPFYRLYLNEKLRKFLGINLKHRTLYLFTIKNITYLSADMIPKSTKFKKINVILGNCTWYIDIPTTNIRYIPNNFKLINTPGKVIKLIK